MQAHTLTMKVRDYECDLQGVVNNSVYQHYLEHARHEFLLSVGVDFAALAAQDINLLVVRAELDYKMSLRPGDRFRVCTRVVRSSRIRFAFLQDIFREPDQALILQGKITGAAVNERGRPFMPAQLDVLLAGMNQAE